MANSGSAVAAGEQIHAASAAARHAYEISSQCHRYVAPADADASVKGLAVLGWRTRTRSPARTRSHGRLPSNVIVNLVGLKINLKLLSLHVSSKPKP